MEVSTKHDTGDCRAVSDVLSRIGDKWTVYVVGLLSNGPMRFNEIRRQAGSISQRMLTLTLRGLERDGLVTRTIYPTIPPRVDYELTELGRTLIAILSPPLPMGRRKQAHCGAVPDAVRCTGEWQFADERGENRSEAANPRNVARRVRACARAAGLQHSVKKRDAA